MELKVLKVMTVNQVLYNLKAQLFLLLLQGKGILHFWRLASQVSCFWFYVLLSYGFAAA
jgi:hypothetical protein